MMAARTPRPQWLYSLADRTGWPALFVATVLIAFCGTFVIGLGLKSSAPPAADPTWQEADVACAKFVADRLKPTSPDWSWTWSMRTDASRQWIVGGYLTAHPTGAPVRTGVTCTVTRKPDGKTWQLDALEVDA